LHALELINKYTQEGLKELFPEESKNTIEILKKQMPKFRKLSTFRFLSHNLQAEHTDEFAAFAQNNMKSLSTLEMITEGTKKEYKLSPQKTTLEQKTGPRAPSNPEKQNLPPQKKHKKA
jgi:hypothetical protein